MGGASFPWLLLAGFFIVIALEMFLPSAGVLFILSICLAIAAIIFAFVQSFWTGIIMAIIVFGSIPFLIGIFAYVWPQTPLGRRFIISAPDAESVLPESLTENPIQELKGQKGIVTIPMLPTGEIKIGNKRYSATSQSGSIEIGTEVRIVEIRMSRLIVLPAEMTDDVTAPGGFEENLEKTVENTSFEDFSWDEE